jgi:DNA-binding CsgD family transcriptional regulator
MKARVVKLVGLRLIRDLLGGEMIGPPVRCQRTVFRNTLAPDSLESNAYWRITGMLKDVEGCVISLTIDFRNSVNAGRREPEIIHKLWQQLRPYFSGRRVICSQAASEPRADGPAAGEWKLTVREQLVTEFVADGLTNREVARRLCITVATVKKHLTHAMAKTGSASRTQLAVLWRGTTGGVCR